MQNVGIEGLGTALPFSWRWLLGSLPATNLTPKSRGSEDFSATGGFRAARVDEKLSKFRMAGAGFYTSPSPFFFVFLFFLYMCEGSRTTVHTRPIPSIGHNRESAICYEHDAARRSAYGDAVA